MRAKHKDGHHISIEASTSEVFGPDGELKGFMSVIRDISERKNMEEQLKEYSQRLEQMVEERTKELRDAQDELVRKGKLAILGELSGGIGHELRNPLGAIKNAGYFLNMVIENPEPEVKETLEILDKEVATSERIISSLMDFARQKPPSRRKTAINNVVQEALSSSRVPQKVKVINQLDDSLPDILADPDQLGRVFGNIILNAVQAMPDGGTLTLTSKAHSQNVTVSVADTGVGISPEALQKLFEPLYTTKPKGIGLGLAITRSMVEAHGGTITVQSEVGQGTTFTITLPLASGEGK
jgi:signal transduction histidine kinase